MSLPGLYAVLDDEVASAHGWTVIELARALLDSGVRFLQVRAKLLASDALLALADTVVQTAQPYAAVVIVNDRADVAHLAGAHGVHVGQDDLDPSEARAIVGDSALVGLSTHTAAQIADAAGKPISYLAVGPVFDTRTKETGYEAVGLDLVRVAARTGRPVVAIGGVTLERSAEVFAAGATSIAVISDLFTGGQPAARAARWLEQMRLAGGAL